MADARATEEETEVDEMSIVRTGSIANHVNAKKFEMALHKSESLADYPAEKVWKHVDVDKSGGLDKKEFFEMYQLLQKHVDTQQKELVEEKHKIWESSPWGSSTRGPCPLPARLPAGCRRRTLCRGACDWV